MPTQTRLPGLSGRPSAPEVAEKDRLLTLSDVAARLRLSRAGAYNLVRSGALRFIDIGAAGKRCVRVRPEDLEDFLRARTSDNEKGRA